MRLTAPRTFFLLLFLLATPSAFADIGPDATDFVLALLAWLPFVGLSLWIAPVPRRWVAGTAALLGYPYAWLAFGAFAQRVVSDYYAASRVVLWVLLIAGTVFIAWLLILRWRDRKVESISQKLPVLDLAVVLLVVPALAVAIAPIELVPLHLDGLKQYASIFAPVLVFASLLAAYGLRKRWLWAWLLAGGVVLFRLFGEFVRLVKLPGLFQFGAHGGEAQIGMLLLLVPILIVAQLGVVGVQVMLGSLLLHPDVRIPITVSRNAARFNFNMGTACVLILIVAVTAIATPKVRQISILMAQQGIYQQKQKEIARIKQQNIADMHSRAATQAASMFDAMPRQGTLPFATLSADDVSSFIASTSSVDCDVRLWRKGDAAGWNQPRIVWRLALREINAITLKLDVTAMARSSDGVRLRYVESELHMPPRAEEMDATGRIVEVRHNALGYATGLEHGSSLFLLLGAEPIYGDVANNSGRDYEHSDARHVAAYHFAFYPSWSEEDRALFRQQESFVFDLVTDDPRIEQPMEWREWIVVRSDDSILVAVEPPALEARLADASQMPALRALMPANYYGISEGSAQFRLTGLHRLSATITDLKLQKRQIDLLQQKKQAIALTARIEWGAAHVSDVDTVHSARDIRSIYQDASVLQVAASCDDGAPEHLRAAVRHLLGKESGS